MSGRKRAAKKRLRLPVLAAVLIVLAAFLALNSRYGFAPGLTWDALFEQTGLTQGQIAPRTDTLEVHFINVGQGDCTLIVTKDKAALIDAGEAEQGVKVRKYLDGLGITRLDYVIGTHPHSDHIGGLAYIIEQFEVGEVILPEIPDEIVPTTRAYEKLLLAVSDKGLPITPAVLGRVLDIGDGMEILAPVRDYGNLNNESVVCRLDYGATSFLFTGDMEKEAVDDVLASGADVRAAVLKVAHHGSAASTTEDFLAAVSPAYAVISCGAGNSYGHPNGNMVKRLEGNGAQIYRTDLNGTVVIASDGAALTAHTSE